MLRAKTSPIIAFNIDYLGFAALSEHKVSNISLFLSAIVFLVVTSPAVEVLAVHGRCETQPAGALLRHQVTLGAQIQTNDLLQVYQGSSLWLGFGSLDTLELVGPAQVRYNQVLSAKDGSIETVFTEFEGTVRLSRPAGPQTWRLQCGNRNFGIFSGELWVNCMQNNGFAWLVHGNSFTQHNSQPDVVLAPGSALAWVDAKERLIPVDSVKPKLVGQVSSTAEQERIDWIGVQGSQAGKVASTQWNVKEGLEHLLSHTSGLAKSPNSECGVAVVVDTFSVFEDEESWGIHTVLRLQLINRIVSLKNRSLPFRATYRATPDEAKSLALLRYIPLEADNKKLKTSPIGRWQRDILEFVTRNALDPFAREGYSTSE